MCATIEQNSVNRWAVATMMPCSFFVGRSRAAVSSGEVCSFLARAVAAQNLRRSRQKGKVNLPK
jgi:hypothetical protein